MVCIGRRGLCAAGYGLLGGQQYDAADSARKGSCYHCSFAAPLRVGDVVLLAAGADRYVVHRVWKINAAAIRTLGDNCANPDPWIPKDHVLGQAILYSRNNVKHRLDTTAARLWGRAWMAAFPLRKRCIQLKCIIRRCYKKLFLSHGPGVRAMNTDTQPETLSQLIAQLNAGGANDYRRYDAVRTFLNFKARDKGIPLSGTFELTPLCNLDCKMCYVHLNQAQIQGAQRLSAEQWKQLMQQAIDAGMMYARLTGASASLTRDSGNCISSSGIRGLKL